MTNWYYLDGPVTGGPVDDDELRRLAALGRLCPASPVTAAGASRWFTAADYEVHLRLRYGVAGTAAAEITAADVAAPVAEVTAAADVAGTAAAEVAAADVAALVEAAFGPALGEAAATPAAAPAGPVAPLPGSLGRRLLAAILDAILFGVPALTLCLLVGGITALEDGPRTNYRIEGRGVLLLGVLGLLYFGVQNGHGGQTAGKALTGLRVVDIDDGGPIGVLRGIGRFMAVVGLLALCVVPVVVDAAWALFDRERQTLHDQLMDSVVVRVSRRHTVARPPARAATGRLLEAATAQPGSGRSETQPNSDSPSPSS